MSAEIMPACKCGRRSFTIQLHAIGHAWSVRLACRQCGALGFGIGSKISGAFMDALSGAQLPVVAV